jgi:DNA replication and repair protein RecF
MTLRRLQVTDFRCLQSVALDLDPRFTLISGPNASGKTSLLEAIYVLGRGRSFRTRRIEQLVRQGAERFVVFGEIESLEYQGSPELPGPARVPERRIPVGVEGSSLGVRARIGGAAASSLADLALALPVQVIDPEVHALIEEGPNRRRRFLDWGVFHVKQSFVGDWQRYRQALKQRNAALKAGQPSGAVSAWDGDLVRYGELLTDARARYVALLARHAEPIGRNLLGLDLTLNYRAGWARELSFSEALQQSRSHDQMSGVTQVGPHRAELGIRLNGHPVKDRISRGQQKLLAAALLIAQLKLFPEDAPLRPSLLLDDPAAELDDERLASLIREVSSHSVQLIVTTLNGEFSAFGTPGRRFGVSAGRVEAH